jgi:hypothetical protein
MSEKIVSLRGNFILPPAQPNLTLIEEIERLLEAARAGEIVGMAGTYVHKDKTVSFHGNYKILLMTARILVGQVWHSASPISGPASIPPP